MEMPNAIRLAIKLVSARLRFTAGTVSHGLKPLRSDPRLAPPSFQLNSSGFYRIRRVPLRLLSLCARSSSQLAQQGSSRREVRLSLCGALQISSLNLLEQDLHLDQDDVVDQLLRPSVLVVPVVGAGVTQGADLPGGRELAAHLLAASGLQDAYTDDPNSLANVADFLGTSTPLAATPRRRVSSTTAWNGGPTSSHRCCGSCPPRLLPHRADGSHPRSPAAGAATRPRSPWSWRSR
jgi:hypothetical protein